MMAARSSTTILGGGGSARAAVRCASEEWRGSDEDAGFWSSVSILWLY